MIMMIVNHSELVYGILPGDIEFPWRLYFVICVFNNSVSRVDHLNVNLYLCL